MRLLLIAALFIFAMTTAQADDADTLTVDGTRYRLDGIDAPEKDQPCLDEHGSVYPCGQFAIEALDQLISDRPILCEDRGPDRKYPNRHIGRCTVDGIDLHRWLARNGWALDIERHSHGRYQEDQRHAEEHRLGMWKGCFAAPRDFRYWNYTAPLLGRNCPRDAHRKLFPTHALMPEGCEIKGKYALRALLTGHRGIYHVPGCRSYRRTKNVDRWFCSEEDAIAAGFRLSFTC